MIGPGWLPRPPRLWRKRTLAYTRIRRRSSRRANRGADRPLPVHHEGVIFDHGPSEFPVAIVRPREPRARAVAIAIELGSWLGSSWRWLRPRTVPVLVAALGMVWMIAAANYLARHADAPPSPTAERVIPVQIDTAR